MFKKVKVASDTSSPDITERKRVEEALRLFSHSVESLVDGMAIGGLNGKITYVNKAFIRMFGYSKEELIGKKMAFIYSEEQIPKLKEAIKATMEGGWTGELTGKRKDGQLFPAAVLSSRVVDDKDNVIAHMVSHRDITEQKRMEQELREARDKLEKRMEEALVKEAKIIDTITDAVITTDLSGNITSYNTGAERMYRYKAQEVMGKSLSMFYLEEDTPLMMDQIAEVLKGNTISSVEARIIGKNKREVSVLLSLAPIRNSEGEIIELAGIAKDITERKRMVEILKGSEKKFRTFMETASDLMDITDRDGKFTYVNESMARTLGYSKEEMIGKHITEILTKEALGKDFKPNWGKFTTDGEISLETTFLTKEGREIYGELKMIAIYDDDGKYAGGRAVFRDITERKRVEYILNERVKELQCLYGIADVAERPGITLGKLSQEVANLMSASWQYPGITCARVIIDGKKFETENCRDTEWKQSSDIKVHGAKVGTLEVYYLEERPELDEGPFLKEERLLIDAVAERLGKITERKRVEEELRESEEKYRALFDNLNDAPFLADVETGCILDTNKQGEVLLGRTREEIIGMHQRELHPQEMANEYRQRFATHVQKGRGADFDGEVIKKDGSIVPVSISAAPVTIGGKRLILGLFRDITERKRIEEALCQSEEKYRTLVENIPQRIFIKDKNLVYVSCNKSFAQDCKVKPEELAGKTDYDFFPKELAEKYRADDKRIIESGETESIEEKYIQAKQERIVQTFKTPVRGEKGNVVGILGIFHDITEHKRMEQELREAQEKLVRSKRLAAIGQLAGGVGHELRNPLGAIKNAAYYVKGKVAESELAQKEPRVVEFLDTMEDEINASTKIISDLLGFSRVAKPSASPSQIKNVIEDALSGIAIPESIELTKRVDTDLPEVEIDTDQVQQVLVNMIMNAVEAMPEGGKLTIGARGKGRLVEVKIADTGCGIPQEAMGKIFDPLFTTKAKGIGFGLGVCKGIIDRHEGSIEVKSQVGKGTTFIIRLPLRAE